MIDVILRKFQQNIISFLDELIETFPSEPDLVLGRLFVSNQADPEFLIKSFILEVLPHKQIINDKDEELFLKSDFVLFKNLDKNKVNYFQRLWRSPAMDDENREVFWAWIESFVVLAEQYQKHKLN